MYSNRYVFVIIVEVIILLLLLYIYSYKKTIKEHHTDHSDTANPNVTFYKRNCVVYPVVKDGSGKQCAMGTTCGTNLSKGCDGCTPANYRLGMTTATGTRSVDWADAAAKNGNTLQSTAGRFYADDPTIASDEAASAAVNVSKRKGNIGFTVSDAYRASLDSDGKVISVDCIPPAPTGEIIHEHFQSYGKNIEFFNNNRVEHFEDTADGVNKKVIYYFALHADHKSFLTSFTVKLNITPNGTWKTTAVGGSFPLSETETTAAMSLIDVSASVDKQVGAIGASPLTVSNIKSGSDNLSLNVKVKLIEGRSPAQDAARADGNTVHADYVPTKLRFEITQSGTAGGTFNINHKSISIILLPTWTGNTPWDADGAATSTTMAKFYNNVKPEVIALEPATGLYSTFENDITCATNKGQKCIDNTYKYIAQPDDDSPFTLWDTHINNTHLYHNNDIKSHTIGTNAPYMLLNAPSAAAVNLLFSTYIDGLSFNVATGITKKDGAKAFGNYWKRLLDNDDKANFFKELVTETATAAAKKIAVTKLITAIYAYLLDQTLLEKASRDDYGKIAKGVHAILLWIKDGTNNTLLVVDTAAVSIYNPSNDTNITTAAGWVDADGVSTFTTTTTPFASG